MQIIVVLILISLILAAGFLIAYLRAAQAGQFDDDCTPAIRMLFDTNTPDKNEEDQLKTTIPQNQHPKEQDDSLT